jgi:glutathionylspermidine synthase
MMMSEISIKECQQEVIQAWNDGFDACMDMVKSIFDNCEKNDLPIHLWDEIVESYELMKRDG